MSFKYDIQGLPKVVTFSDGSNIKLWKIRPKSKLKHTSYFDNIERRLGVEEDELDFITEREMEIV